MSWLRSHTGLCYNPGKAPTAEGVEAQFPCDSGVPDTAPGGTLNTREGIDTYALYYTEGTDSDCSYYIDEEGRQEFEVGSVCASAVDAVDCLTPESIRIEQDNQTEIQLIKQWKAEGRKPDWSEIARYGPELKAYWSTCFALLHASVTAGHLALKRLWQK